MIKKLKLLMQKKIKHIYAVIQSKKNIIFAYKYLIGKQNLLNIKINSQMN